MLRVMDVTVLEKVYRKGAEESLVTLLSDIVSRYDDVQIDEVQPSFRKWARVRLKGEGDVESCASEIVAEYDEVRCLPEVEEGSVIYGKIIDLFEVGYGVYVDIGVVGPQVTDALIPLYTLREQLAHGVKASVRDIGRSFGFVENLPLEVEIVKVDENEGEIEARLTEDQAYYLLEMAADPYDRIIVSGMTRKGLQRAFKRAGVARLVRRIERWGLLENEVILDEGVDAPGILAKVGPYLPGCDVELVYDDKFIERLGFIPSPEGPIHVG